MSPECVYVAAKFVENAVVWERGAEVQWRSLLSHGQPFFALVSGDPCGGRMRFGLEPARFANTEACALAYGRVVLARSESGFAEVRRRDNTSPSLRRTPEGWIVLPTGTSVRMHSIGMRVMDQVIGVQIVTDCSP